MSRYTGWAVKEDAESAISLGRIVSFEPGGYGARTEDRTFLPGDYVPDMYVDPVLDRMDSAPPTDEETGVGGDHLWRFLEYIGERPEKVTVPVASAPPPPPQTEESSWDNPDLTVPVLQAEVAKRNISVQGSGANGNVVKDDYVNALKRDDIARSNPFA